MRAGLLLRREEARALEHDVDAEGLPRQLRGVTLGANLDLVAVDDQRIALDLDRVFERPVRGVVARQMRVRFRVAEVVHRDDLDLAAVLAFVERAKDVAADSAVAIDCDFDGHGEDSPNY